MDNLGLIQYFCMFGPALAAGFATLSKASKNLRIPVNVTADSGNVTGNSGERDRGSVLRVWILYRFVFSAVFPVLNWRVFE